MGRYERLLAKAKRNPAGLRLEELCRLAEHAGFEFVRQRGSHRIYRHHGLGGTLSVQDFRGEAKPYQVRQLISVIEEIEDFDG